MSQVAEKIRKKSMFYRKMKLLFAVAAAPELRVHMYLGLVTIKIVI
jgi:hypothetical protein